MVHAADRHLQASLHHVSDHYMGEHWLATFAALALEAQGQASPGSDRELQRESLISRSPPTPKPACTGQE